MTDARTTETLRINLFEAMKDVRAGKITTHQGNAIAKLADKIIATAELELKYSTVLYELKKQNAGLKEVEIKKLTLTEAKRDD